MHVLLRICLVLSLLSDHLTIIGYAGTVGLQTDLSHVVACSQYYDIDPTPLSSTVISDVYKARDTELNARVIIKVFKNDKYYQHEASVFNEIESRIIQKSANNELFVVDQGKKEEFWSHFVRLILKCHHLSYAALVIESLDVLLSEAITLQQRTVGDPRSSSYPAVLQVPPCYTPSATYFFKSYAYQLLTAVDTLHGLGILHLDLKPKNIGMTSYGLLKLFDFGLSGTNVGDTFSGTIIYSAPEMHIAGLPALVRQSNEANKIDMWSVGCTIYEIFAGKRFLDELHTFYSFVLDINPEIKKCKNQAAYFYLKWLFGSPSPTMFSDEYDIAEQRAKEQCPHIFSEKLIDRLKFTNPSIYFYAKNVKSLGEGPETEFYHKMKLLAMDDKQRKWRLEPSFTEPSELIELLTDLLKFHFSQRITANTALMQYPIFRTSPHQDAVGNNYGTRIRDCFDSSKVACAIL